MVKIAAVQIEVALECSAGDGERDSEQSDEAQPPPPATDACPSLAATASLGPLADMSTKAGLYELSGTQRGMADFRFAPSAGTWLQHNPRRGTLSPACCPTVGDTWTPKRDVQQGTDFRFAPSVGTWLMPLFYPRPKRTKKPAPSPPLPSPGLPPSGP